MSLKILTWLWSQPGGVYAPWQVRIWAAMIRKHLTLPHSLAVVTNMAGDFGEGVEVIAPPGDLEDARIPTWGPKKPQCFRRLAMFRPDAADIFGAGRIVCTDLDLVVSGSLDPLLDIEDDFKITHGTWRTRAYNGSLMSLRAGSRTKAFTEFTPERAIEAGQRHLGSDQSWLAHILPGAPTWKPDDGVSFWMADPRPDARVTFFAGGTKPWALAMVGNGYCARHYRGQRDGRCLVLGHGPHLWTELDAALAEPFEAVIASPEAAAYWSGPLLAIADDDAHAERLAAMHGFDEVTFCGRTMERDANVAA